MSAAATPGGAEHFPGFDVMSRARAWDPVTRALVEERIAAGPPLHFFAPAEQDTAGALLDRLLAQDAEPKVPLLALIDARLLAGETDGWHYDDMPEDGDAWRHTLHALDEDAARHAAGATFATLSRAAQIELLERVRTAETWHGLPAGRVWSMWMRYACAAFYSHPLAWNEIGFGGPAYPTGYKNLGVDGREAWEVAEHDAMDPEPWARRVERARRRHEGGDR